MNVSDHLALSEYEEKKRSIVLRRYLTFEKFQKLISTGSLFFSPASAFRDEIEGHKTYLDIQYKNIQLESWGFSDTELNLASRAEKIHTDGNRQSTVILCWTSDISEDIRKWREYGVEKNSVAIETTVGQLADALGENFLLVRVQYIDFYQETIPKTHSMLPFCFKRDDFRWENEVRAIGNMEVGRKLGTPRLVKVDLSKLLNKVLVSAESDRDFHLIVKGLLAGCGLNVDVFKSRLEHKVHSK